MQRSLVQLAAALKARAFSGLQNSGVDIRVSEAGDFPFVEVDPFRIREVLTNLLTNALRYTPPGGSITMMAVPDATQVRISVEDTGTGIDPLELPRIFDRFAKGSNSRGSGLGLAIARNLVTAHGGEIWAAPRSGGGTVVSFTLPLVHDSFSS